MSGHPDNHDDETVESTSPFPQYPGVGSTVGIYTITEVVESGGMGVVYRATDPDFNREVAVKIISPSIASAERFRQRFLDETRTMGSLRSPYILPVFRTGEHDGLLYLSTPLIEGGDLRRMINEQGQMEPSDVATVVTQVARALDTAHANGLIHRDVKPSNVLVESSPDGLHCYLADFGIARDIEQTSGITGTGEVLGSVDYMAPEVIEGGRSDERTDVYSLGCMAVEMLTGQPPFRRSSKRETMGAHLHDDPQVAGLPRGAEETGLVATLARAIAKNPDNRFTSCSEFARELNASLTPPEDATTVIPTSPVAPVSKPRKRRKLIAFAGVIVLLLVAAGAGAYVARQTDSSSPPLTAATDPSDDHEGVGVGPGEGSKEQEAAPSLDPVAAEVPMSDLLETEDFNDEAMNSFSELLTVPDFVEESGGDTPRIGSEEFTEGLLFRLDNDTLQQDFSIGVHEDWTRFEAEIGLEQNEARHDEVGVTFLVSDGASEQVLEEFPNLTAGMPPRPVSLDLDPMEDPLLIIRFDIKYVDRHKETSPLVVFGDARFSGSG